MTILLREYSAACPAPMVHIRQASFAIYVQRHLIPGIVASFLLLAHPPFISPAGASGAYFADASPTLPQTCHELGVAFLSVAWANQSAPNIGRALRLAAIAKQGCQTNPRESIRLLEVALHLVTPQ